VTEPVLRPCPPLPPLYFRKGYEMTIQTGSHLRLTTRERGEHHVTIPNHDPLKVGTLAAVLDDVGGHFELSRDELLRRLFDR